MAKQVTLRFGDELLDLECHSVHVPMDEAEEADDIPPGYVRIETAEEHDSVVGSGGQIPFIGDGNTALVSDEYVALIQWGADPCPR